MTTYSIGEAAEHSGFSTSALRYYEGIGLVAPSTRTGAGYRRYDERALARLAFVARAKQLGCTLEEITDLVGVWDGERCDSVQHRLHELVTAKIAEAERQMGELASFRHDLAVAAAQLRSPASDEACGDSCACVSAACPPAVPVGCTLEAEARPGRMRAWSEVASAATDRTRLPDGGWRLELGRPDAPAISLHELAELVVAEQRCCSFFAFAITVDARGIALEIRVPPEAQVVADALVLGTAE